MRWTYKKVRANKRKRKTRRSKRGGTLQSGSRSSVKPNPLLLSAKANSYGLSADDLNLDLASPVMLKKEDASLSERPKANYFGLSADDLNLDLASPASIKPSVGCPLRTKELMKKPLTGATLVIIKEFFTLYYNRVVIPTIHGLQLKVKRLGSTMLPDIIEIELSTAFNKIAAAQEGISIKEFVEITILGISTTFFKPFLTTIFHKSKEKDMSLQTVPLKVTIEELIIPQNPVTYASSDISGLKSYISVLFYEAIEIPITTTFHRCLFRLEKQKITPAQCNSAFSELITHATLVKGAYNTLCKMESFTVYEIYGLWENCCSCLQRMLEYFENFEISINVSEVTTYYNKTKTVDNYCRSLPDCSAKSSFLNQTAVLNLQILNNHAEYATRWCQLTADNICSYVPPQKVNKGWSSVQNVLRAIQGLVKPLPDLSKGMVRLAGLLNDGHEEKLKIRDFQNTKWYKDTLVNSNSIALQPKVLLLGLGLVAENNLDKFKQMYFKNNDNGLETSDQTQVNKIRTHQDLSLIKF